MGMTDETRAHHVAPRTLTVIAVALLTAFVPLASFAKLETWREEGSSAFAKGKREGLVVTEEGRLILGRVLSPEGRLQASRVWSLAEAPNGDLFAATGDEGKVYRRNPDARSDWVVALETGDSQALAVAVSPDGKVVVGTGPSGKVVNLSEPGQPSSRPHPDVLYIWALAFDQEGNLFAATGPKGELWKRSPAGEWSLVQDTKADHLLCLAMGPDGSVYTGGDRDGVIYRVGRDGGLSVVYDATQSEVRALIVLPDGTIYAGTAADNSGGGSRSGLATSERATTTLTASTTVDEKKVAAREPVVQKTPEKKAAEEPTKKGSTGGGTASPRTVSPGDNSVYRITPDGVAREVFRAKVLVHALAYRDDRLLIGTGPEGVLHELSDRDRKSTPVARLDSGHIVALLAGSGGSVFIGTADPGRVARLGVAHVSSGTFESEVRDTKLISRFGAMDWVADEPPGTSVVVQVRSGNVAEPDKTWSDWSASKTGGPPSPPNVPAGRFVQYRVTLGTTEPTSTPMLRSLSLRYQSANLAPEISKLEVPDLGGMDGSTKQARLTFRWDASDPNSDDLQYTLEIRKDGWPEWIRLTEEPITEKTHAIDTASMPAGRYQVRLIADDRLSNNPADALSEDRLSETFLIDGVAPSVTLSSNDGKVSALLKDNATRITKASYSVDGKPWVAVFPEDGLFDTPEETLALGFDDLSAGPHVIVVRAIDAAGNMGTADILLQRP